MLGRRWGHFARKHAIPGGVCEGRVVCLDGWLSPSCPGSWLQDDHPAQRICRLSRELQAPAKAQVGCVAGSPIVNTTDTSKKIKQSFPLISHYRCGLQVAKIINISIKSHPKSSKVIKFFQTSVNNQKHQKPGCTKCPPRVEEIPGAGMAWHGEPL